MSDFSRRKALGVDAKRRVVTIPAEDWKKFVAWANRPATEIQGLKDLVAKAATWQNSLEDCNRLSSNGGTAQSILRKAAE